jgi:hypothetical protein
VSSVEDRNGGESRNLRGIAFLNQISPLRPAPFGAGASVEMTVGLFYRASQNPILSGLDGKKQAILLDNLPPRWLY